MSIRRQYSRWIGLAILCLCLGTRVLAAANDQSLAPRKYILSIGISQFNDHVWHQLRYADKDARDVYAALNGKVGHFDGGQLVGADGIVTRADFMNALQRLHDVNRQEEDTVFIYVSTHGSVAYRPDGRIGRFIITSDTDSQHVNQTAVDYDTLIESFRSLRSRKKVLILAFCHSGVGKSVLTPDMKRALAKIKAPFFEEPIQESSEGSIILTASGWREPALEDQRLENDVYTYFLIKGFDQDLNHDGAVSITEAHSYAAEQTFRFTRGQQRPSAILELLGADPVFVKGQRQKRGSAMLYSFINRFSDLMVSVNGEDKGSLKKGIDIPEGKVRIVIKDPSNDAVLADRFVSFEAGRDYAIDNILIPTLPNSWVLGARMAQFVNDQEKGAYAPENLTGIYGRYLHEEGLLSWDAGFDLAYFPKHTESITAKGGQTFIQKRQMAFFGLLIGNREVIPWLSAKDRRYVTEFQWLLGPRALMIQRQNDDPAFRRREENRLTPGMGLILGVQYTVPYYLLKVGIEADFAAHDRISEEAKGISTLAQWGAYVGTYW